jgi:acyl carrier protein
MKTDSNQISTPSNSPAVSTTGEIQTAIPTLADIQNWLVSYIADVLEIEPEKVDVTKPFDRYGLDSAAAVGLTGDMEEWLGFDLDPTLPYDYPTIQALANHIAEEAGGQA